MPPPKECYPGATILVSRGRSFALVRLDPQEIPRFMLIDERTKGIEKLRWEYEAIALEQRVVIWGLEQRGPDVYGIEVRFEGKNRPRPKKRQRPDSP